MEQPPFSSGRRDILLDPLSLSDLENYREILKKSIAAIEHILEGMESDTQGAEYYRRLREDEKHEIANVQREILKRKI